MRSRFTAALVLLCACVSAQHQRSSSEILEGIRKLNVLGAVLYVAAHPDDENTRVIAALSKEKLITTAYLSMTRGDGGQNLVGPEIEELLGLIRTQELLAARRIDGGQQFFTRAVDFGFSKSADETLAFWGREEILSDVVKVIRQFQPDVILTRFPPDERAGHGHHTSSAVLAIEAFDAAADANRFPDQVREFGVWQATRLLTNTGRWWNDKIDENTPGISVYNVGGYNSALGASYTEIASVSRSQHKSQGFGSAGRRGDSNEYFEFSKGAAAGKDILSGISMGWARVKGAEKVPPMVDKAIREFNPGKPELSVPALLEILKAIEALTPSLWRDRKLGEVNRLIQDCLGLYAEVTPGQYWIAPGESFSASVEIINRSAVPVKLTGITAPTIGWDTAMSVDFSNNKLLNFRSSRKLSSTSTYTDPYWLRDKHAVGLYSVSNKAMVGLPENPPSAVARFRFEVAGERLEIERPLVFRWTDPVKGELSRPLEIVPPVFVNLSGKVFLFRDAGPLPVTVTVKSALDRKAKGSLKLNLPPGWKSEPQTQEFELTRREQELSLTFSVTPATSEANEILSAEAAVDGKVCRNSLVTVTYDHIPPQIYLPPAEARLIRISLKKEGTTVAYIRGAGDETPAALRAMGYQVWEMKDDEVTPLNLRKVDAVVVGIRALNTNDRIRYFMPDLLDYVQAGGTLVMQYNNNFGIDTDSFSPFPLTLGRDRVTQEDAEVRMLKPDHPALTYPNRISSADFAGWVQERGLYFPSKWDPAFEALLSSNDKGEPARDGGLLIAKYGAGHYVYTSYSWFRQLPEGVPGAYKLFANLVSLGKAPKPESTKVKASRR
jgi:LmbE family N-acetylglucosaminyl deacetylase